MPPVGTTTRRLVVFICMIAGATTFAACSTTGSRDAEPTATAIAFGPDDVAVGTLIDDGRPAWTSAEAWTVQTQSDASAAGGGISTSSTESAIIPGQRHMRTMNGETLVTEEIAIGTTIYMRGSLVSSSIYPDVDATTWITFEADQVPADTPLAQEVAYLTAPPEYPLADVTAGTRALPASPSGEVRAGDRTCQAWTFTTTTADTPGIDYTLAFDDQNRPCQLVRESGGVVETTTWTYPDHPEPIVAPADATKVQAFPDLSG